MRVASSLVGFKRIVAVALTFVFSPELCSAQQRLTANILLYTATADFRHDSIPTAIEALRNQSDSGIYNVRFDATEDKLTFSSENLANY